MADTTPKRPMKYPYTLTAKIVQFPLKYYLKSTWGLKYWFFALAVSAPIFYKLEKAVNSPENVAKWSEFRRKQYSGDHH